MNRLMKVKREFKRTRHKFIIFTALTFLGLLLLLNIRMTPKPPIMACHYNTNNTSLPTLMKNETLPMQSIFFIEPSCAENLTVRQSCAIESAAKSNPKWQINVISSGLTYKSVEKSTQLKKMMNIKFWKVNIEEFAKGTPLAELLASGILKTCWDLERTLDVLKYLILGKWSGIYIDLDMVVVRPLGSLARNWVTREDDEIIAEGIFGFSMEKIGKIVIDSVIRRIQEHFKNKHLCHKPRILNEILRIICSTVEVGFMSSETCNGFEVYGKQFFYPIPRERARVLFKPGELGSHNAYTYYLWGQDTKDYRVMKGSPYSKLAKIYCPETYKRYGSYFGL